MSEQNKNNDPLEQFFRQKAKEYDIQYREKDWQKLETRLDEADKQHVNQRRRYIAAAVIILLFAVLGYFTYEQQQTINQLNNRLNSAENEVIADLPYNIFELLPDETDDSDVVNDQNAADKIEPPSTSESSDLVAREQPTASDDNSKTASSDESANENDRQNFERTITESRLVTIANASPGFGGRFPAISAINPVKISSTEDNAKNQQASLSEPKSSDRLHQKKPRMSAGILVGPDLSTVGGISNFVDPGHKIGLTVEYHITQNLAISAGAQHTRVRYVATGNNYRLPEGYLPYGTSADEIAGECFLIDIPISLKYDFMHFHDSRFYASAGLSS